MYKNIKYNITEKLLIDDFVDLMCYLDDLCYLNDHSLTLFKDITTLESLTNVRRFRKDLISSTILSAEYMLKEGIRIITMLNIIEHLPYIKLNKLKRYYIKEMRRETNKKIHYIKYVIDSRNRVICDIENNSNNRRIEIIDNYMNKELILTQIEIIENKINKCDKDLSSLPTFKEPSCITNTREDIMLVRSQNLDKIDVAILNKLNAIDYINTYKALSSSALKLKDLDLNNRNHITKKVEDNRKRVKKYKKQIEDLKFLKERVKTENSQSLLNISDLINKINK